MSIHTEIKTTFKQFRNKRQRRTFYIFFFEIYGKRFQVFDNIITKYCAFFIGLRGGSDHPPPDTSNFHLQIKKNKQAFFLSSNKKKQTRVRGGKTRMCKKSLRAKFKLPASAISLRNSSHSCSFIFSLNKIRDAYYHF